MRAAQARSATDLVSPCSAVHTRRLLLFNGGRLQGWDPDYYNGCHFVAVVFMQQESAPCVPATLLIGRGLHAYV